jgi:hypothetical protein
MPHETPGAPASANCAVIAASPSTTSVSGLLAPVASPLQPPKYQPACGTAVSVTGVPSG